MLRKALTGILLGLWIFVPGVCIAERDPMNSPVPRGKWWRVPRLAEELRLTDEEKNKLDDLFLDYRRKVLDLKAIMERGWLELDNLLEKEMLDEAAAMEEFEKLRAARSDLATEGFGFLLEVRKVLGSDRYQRLKGIFKEMRKQRKMTRKGFERRPEGGLSGPAPPFDG